MYQHRDWQGSLLDFPVNKVVCVGSNYADHIKEMGSAVSRRAGGIHQTGNGAVRYSSAGGHPKEFGAVHHEVELAVLIGAVETGQRRPRWRAIAGYGVALDLTLRDLQAGFKSRHRGKRPRPSTVPARCRGLFRWRNSAIRKTPSCR